MLGAPTTSGSPPARRSFTQIFRRPGSHLRRADRRLHSVLGRPTYYSQSSPLGGAFTQISGRRGTRLWIRADGTARHAGDSDLYGEARRQRIPFHQISPARPVPAGVAAMALCPAGVDESGGADLATGRSSCHRLPPATAQLWVAGRWLMPRDLGVKRLWAVDSRGSVLSIQISPGGATHLAGLRPTGSVDCWGWNVNGQSSPPAGPFTQNFRRRVHTCGLQPGGRSPAGDTAGYGSAPTRARPHLQRQIARGNAPHLRGFASRWTVACWGRNEFWAVDSRARRLSPRFRRGGAPCGLRADGSVICWGDIPTALHSTGRHFHPDFVRDSHAVDYESTVSPTCGAIDNPRSIAGGAL